MSEDKEKKAAIIVIRHARDLQDLPTWNDHPEPTQINENVIVTKDGSAHDNDVKVHQPRLNSDGLKRASQLAELLPDWIEKEYLPVSRVITEAVPKNRDSGTSNPFCTIHPYVEKLAKTRTGFPGDKLKLDLYSKNTYPGDFDAFSAQSLLKDGAYSTVIAWEKTGMWSLGRGALAKLCGEDNPDYPKEDLEKLRDYCDKLEHHPDQKQKTPYTRAQLLGSLAKNPDMVGEFPPEKGETVYVYTNGDSAGKFDLQRFQFDGSGFKALD